MENLNITKKYILIGQTLLVAAVLFTVSPVLALADSMDLSSGNSMDLSYGNSMDLSYGNSNSMDLSSGNSNSMDLSYGNSMDLSYGNPNYTNSPSYVNPSYATVSSGSSFSGGIGATSGSYPRVSTSMTGSGSFSGGGASNPVYNYPSASTLAINSGSFSGGSSVLSNYSYYVPSTYFPSNQNFIPNNQVLASNVTPNLSSVYLSDVPYTGAGDTLKVILFTLALMLWSIYLAYVILKRKQNNQEVFASATNGIEIPNDSFVMPSQIGSDTQALENIENYARENKILLSTSASTKLLKHERLNQINSTDIISKISKEDWVCIGESDLEKYL